MKNQKTFGGYDPEKQAEYEQQLIARCGEGAKEGIAQSKQRIQNWTTEDWKKVGGAFERICTDLVGVMRMQHSPESREAQEVIRRHYEWLKQFWTPTRESYAGHGQFMVESELRKPYEAFDVKLPEFAAAAMKAFAATEL